MKNAREAKDLSPLRSKERFIVFGAPAIEEAEIDEVVATMKSGWLGTGPKVASFEERFRAFKGAAHAIAVSSCTAALHVSMAACALKPGDEVITTPLTFCATINAIIHAGATPVLVDIDPSTMNIDVRKVESKITEKTRALLPVHFAGRPCQMDALCAIAERHGLKLIEDCAHAIEAEYQGRKTGTFGDFGCFSFYVTKNLVTGEGGMVLAKREEDASYIKMLALHGMSKDAWKRFGDEGYKHYEVVAAGYKYNMMDLQAAIGLHQLHRIEENWCKRERIWNQYNKAFADFPITLPPEFEPGTRHALHLYTILINPEGTKMSRDKFLDVMTRLGIGVGVHYLSIPEHPFYRSTFNWQPQDYPHAMRVGRQTVSLPLSPKLTDEDVQDVIEGVRKALGR